MCVYVWLYVYMCVCVFVVHTLYVIIFVLLFWEVYGVTVRMSQHVRSVAQRRNIDRQYHRHVFFVLQSAQ